MVEDSIKVPKQNFQPRSEVLCRPRPPPHTPIQISSNCSLKKLRSNLSWKTCVHIWALCNDEPWRSKRILSTASDSLGLGGGASLGSWVRPAQSLCRLYRPCSFCLPWRFPGRSRWGWHCIRQSTSTTTHILTGVELGWWSTMLKGEQSVWQFMADIGLSR